MDTLKIAYTILYSLEHKKKADYMGVLISPSKLGVEPEKWADVLHMLLDEKYISGVIFKENILGETQIDIKNARITLKGAEYLQENSTMKKIAGIATDVITLVKP